MKKHRFFKTPEEVNNFIGVAETLTGVKHSPQEIRNMTEESILGILEKAFAPEGIKQIMQYAWDPLNEVYRQIQGKDHVMYKAIVAFHGG